MRYRRAHVGGGTYLYTVNLADRESMVLVDHVNSLRLVMRGVMERHRFRIDAIVTLPDHLHTI